MGCVDNFFRKDFISDVNKYIFTNNVPEQYTPGSDVANMSIFGFNPEDYYTGRGPLEAGSEGIPTKPEDVISSFVSVEISL